MRAASVLLLLVLLPGFACVTSSDHSGDVSRNRDVITPEEISSLPSANLFEAVQHLRPAWLRSRGPVSGGGATLSYPQIFLDGVQVGDVESLRSLRTDGVQELRFLSARDATTRFGTGYMAGVIEIITRR